MNIARHYPTYKPSLRQKLNPCWWFGNDREPNADSWYMAGKAQWLRQICWHFRNFAFNFKLFVVGINDKEHDRFCSSNPNAFFTYEAKGWKYAYCRLVDERGRYGWMYFPYLSYATADFQFYIGWCPDGRLDFTLRPEKYRG